MRKQSFKKVIASMCCTALLLGFTGSYSNARAMTNEELSQMKWFQIKGNEPRSANDYSEVYKTINTYLENSGRNSTPSSGGGGSSDSAGTPGAAAPMPTPQPVMPESETDAGALPANDEYSETNNQIKGVDEGDIVKTDGKNIYILRSDNLSTNNELIIMKADGENTAELSKTNINYTELEEHSDSYMPDKPSSYSWNSEIYVSGDRLAVITQYTEYPQHTPSNTLDDYAYMPIKSIDKTVVRIYDISAPEKPELVKTLGQDGYYLNSRLIDGKLYLLSSYYVYSSAQDGKPETFVPALYNGGSTELVSANCVVIWPDIQSNAYTVVSSYDVSSGTLISNQSLLGSGNTVYMSRDNLYVAGIKFDTKSSEPYTEGIYEVTEQWDTSTTEISRFSINDGTVKYEVSGKINGDLINQFALDEHNGHLRAVTTVYESYVKVYKDKDRGWVNYDGFDSTTSSSVFILDDNLNITGMLTDIAKDERVQSVRFNGDAGYFVTFRQVDPLFAVDLSNAKNPRIMSALKIPGFSTYMHLFKDGRLLGIGMNADEETGRTNGMKLSMFDVSNPLDVTEKHKTDVNSNYSEALYNHKAMLISAEKDIIAFPSGDGYDIYGYSDDQGFKLKAHISNTGEISYQTRGLYIGSYAYICSTDMITVLDLSSLKLIEQIKY